MIIGNGDIASVLKDERDFLFFASGVSNSLCESPAQYAREWELLKAQDRHRHFVYFSSLSVYYKQSSYTAHKRDVERWVALNFHCSTIVRIGNITWGKNPHTLINYLKNKINNNEEIKILDEYRHILSKEEFLFWMEALKRNPTDEMNITGRFMKVQQIYEEIIEGRL